MSCRSAGAPACTGLSPAARAAFDVHLRPRAEAGSVLLGPALAPGMTTGTWKEGILVANTRQAALEADKALTAIPHRLHVSGPACRRLLTAAAAVSLECRSLDSDPLPILRTNREALALDGPAVAPIDEVVLGALHVAVENFRIAGVAPVVRVDEANAHAVLPT